MQSCYTCCFLSHLDDCTYCHGHCYPNLDSNLDFATNEFSDFHCYLQTYSHAIPITYIGTIGNI